MAAKKRRTTWSKRLRDLRDRLGITQAEAAERLGVSKRAWIAWENSQRVPGRITQRLLKTTFPSDF